MKVQAGLLQDQDPNLGLLRQQAKYQDLSANQHG